MEGASTFSSEVLGGPHDLGAAAVARRSNATSIPPWRFAGRIGPPLRISQFPNDTGGETL